MKYAKRGGDLGYHPEPDGDDILDHPERVIVDMDGVLADFCGAACRLHGRPKYVVRTWDFFKDWGMTAEQFWSPIKACGTGFYEYNVEPYPWLLELVKVIRQHDPDFIIASVAGAGTPSDYYGKVSWVQKYVGSVPVVVVPEHHKYLLSMPGRVLIDDSTSNVDDFIRDGGRAIEFPQFWNRSSYHTGRRIDYVKSCLCRSAPVA